MNNPVISINGVSHYFQEGRDERQVLYDITTGEEMRLDSLFNKEGNNFGFPIERGHKYLIKGFHEDFYPVTDTLDLTGPDAPVAGHIKRWLYFDRPENLALEVLTYKQMDSLALIGSSVALYDITTGEWRTLNLSLKPFSFPPPLALIDEQCSEGEGEFRDKCLGLWRIKDLRF